MLNELACWIRILRRNPAFPAVALPTLALGIGVTVAMLSVVDTVLLRPLPLHEPERLAIFWDDPGSPQQAMFSVLDYLDLRAGLRSFEHFAVNWGTRLEAQGTCKLSVGAEVEAAPCAAVSYNYFAAMGVKPLLGREFTEAEESQSVPQVMLISHALWQRRFGGDPGIAGKQVKLDGAAASIVGVLPQTFDIPTQCHIWSPPGFDAQWRTENRRGARYLRAIARLRRDVSFEQAQRELDAAVEQLPLWRPSRITKQAGRLVPLQEVLTGDSRNGIWLILAAAVVLLLIACANVANLSLGMASSRAREMAVRAAAGAAPVRLLRQSLLESMMLSAAAGVLGVVIAGLAVRLTVALAPAHVPRLDQAGVNSQLLAFAVLAATVTAVLCGLAPAVAAARSNLRESLSDSSRGAGGGRRRIASALVIVEVALAVVAVAGAALVTRSFANLRRVNPGFHARDVLTAKILPASDSTNEQVQHYLQRVLERVRSLPGVQEAAVTVALPLSGWQQEFRFFPSEGATADPSALRVALLHQVSRGYFRTMGIPILSGQDFSPEEEGRRSGGRVIVNQELARRYFPGRDAVGQRIYNARRKAALEIIAVAGDVRYQNLWDPPRPEIYMLAPTPYVLIVRSPEKPQALAAAVRAAVNEVDANQPVAQFKAMKEIVDAASARHRFWSWLLGLLGTGSLILAAAGVYGVVSATVKQRMPEYAVRAAVGAKPSEILRLVLWRTLRLAMIGALAGVVAVLGLGRWLQSLLFEVRPADPLTLGATVLAAVVIAVAAAYVPARAAMRVDVASTLGAN